MAKILQQNLNGKMLKIIYSMFDSAISSVICRLYRPAVLDKIFFSFPYEFTEMSNSTLWWQMFLVDQNNVNSFGRVLHQTSCFKLLSSQDSIF